MSVAAIIVAAGSSSRLGRPKQLILIDGEPMLQRVIRCAHEAGVSPLAVVLGAHRELIQSAIDFASASVVVNENWQEGMASSFREGVTAIGAKAPEAAGVLLMVCDQPRITTGHLRKMINTFIRQSTPSIIASVYAGTRGTPAILPREAIPDMLVFRGGKGARALLANSHWPVVEVAFAGGEVDLDRPEDLHELHHSS
jgi:molybdenum cofactor cytidylyltransferase